MGLKPQSGVEYKQHALYTSIGNALGNVAHGLSNVVQKINPLQYHGVTRYSILAAEIFAVGTTAAILAYNALASDAKPPVKSFYIDTPAAGQAQGTSGTIDDKVVGALPTITNRNEIPYDPIKSLIAEIKAAGGSATPEQISTWAIAAMERQREFPGRQEGVDIMKSTIYAAFSRSDSDGVYQIFKACAEWTGIPVVDPAVIEDLKKIAEGWYQDFDSGDEKIIILRMQQVDLNGNRCL